MMVDTGSNPFGARLDPLSGAVEPESVASHRTLAQMVELFRNSAVAARRAAVRNERIYSTSTAPVVEAEGHLGFNQTRIEPGDVDGEFFMTHGHIHVRPDGETYIGQSGRGGIVLSKDGDVRWVPLEPNVVGYIPPGWTHRSVNVGTGPFVFISVYPALSGQNYAAVKEAGVGARVFRTPSGYRVVRDDGSTVYES